ncbi:unnamed protein product, partial [Symbiodinium sp. CCMP2592]
DDQRAQHHAPLLPCSAAAFATPGTMHAGMLPASATARVLPLLPAFSASAAPAASAPALLPTDSLSCPLSLRGDPEGARALFGSGLDGRGPPISDPASFRPPRPDSYGPVAGRGGASLPDEPMSEHPGAPHVSVATITAADHGGAAPATDNGGRLPGPCAVRALVDEAIGSEASARIATDILAIAQGVTNTQADLDILRNGVSDIAEALEDKIREMWELLQAEMRKERELHTIFQDSVRDRRISDHETLEEHFARLNSMVNDRFIEFDERIHRFNEKRAGSISMQLAETIRHIKHYPDALQQIQINISNAEARIATVEQNATHRIEVIRTEMSRALYDHKESARSNESLMIILLKEDLRFRPFRPQMPPERHPAKLRVSDPSLSMMIWPFAVERDLRDGMMQCLADPISLAAVLVHLFSIARLADRRPRMAVTVVLSVVVAPTITGVHMVVVLVDMDTTGPVSALVAAVDHPVARPAARLVVVALLTGMARLMVDLIRLASGPPAGRAGMILSSASAAPELSRPPCGDRAYLADSRVATDVAEIFENLSRAKKAKCKSFRLDPEPEPAQLRRWIVDMKERVANAFAYDPGYALSWVEIPDGTRYEDLLDECKYGMLENDRNSAFRECVKSIALKNKIQTETERMHTINRRLGSRQILWLLYDFLRPHVTGDSTFKLVDLMKTTIDRFAHGFEQERLEAFSNRWDHVLAGISVDRPEDPVLCALFYEQVREFRCLELDMQLWDRDVSVRNYAYLRTVCVNAITTWRRRRNQEKMYTATRSTSAQRRLKKRESIPKELAEALVAQTILPEARFAEAILAAQSGKGRSCPNAPCITISTRAMTASSFGDFAFACAASFDMACPSVKRKTVSFGNTETRVIESSFPEPAFGPVNRERNLSYSWPENIRGLNSARERRRAHMKAVLWREQVLLDDIDAKTLGNDACVLELTLSQRSACEVFAAAVKSIKRERDLIVQNAKISLRTANGKTNTKGVAHMRIDGLDELIEAYVLESTPSLLSLGKRCKELGYRFIWEPFCDPIFFDPKGKLLKVDVINNIPYLAPSETEVVAGRPDLPRVYPALPAPIIVHEKVVAAGEEPGSELDAVGELDLDMPNAKSVQKSAPDDNKKVPDEGVEKFGEHVTIDTMVLHGLGNRGNNGETDAVVFYDLATEWLESVPVKGRTNADTLRAFQQVFGDLRDVNSFSMDVERRYAPSAIRESYCDKAREFISTCKKGQSAYAMRFDGVEFDGQILPFGCLVDFYPTPARKQTRRSQRDEVVLGDGEEYAVPAPGDDGLIDVEIGFDDDGYLEWIDDGDNDQSGTLQGADVDQRLSSYQRPSKFSPTSKPGIFLGYHFENGGKWDGDYIVADLEDFKRDALRASVHQVKKIYCSPKERWTFPMLAVYDKQTRSMCINDPAMKSCAPQSSERLDASDMLELEDIDEIFALDEPTRMTEEDVRRAREAELRAESSHGGGVDYWDYDPSSHKWTYHVVVPRKAMIHPSKTPGSIGESPDPWKLSTVRISHVQYKDKGPVTIYETGYAFGKTRLMQLWTGTVEFFDDGFAPSKKKKLPPYHGSEILEGEGGLPYRQSVPRSERIYRGSRKPNSIDSESWRSMNRAEREGYVEAERREAESHAMSREDSRDAAPVDMAFDSEYESGAERHDKDYWYHDVAAGTITRFHVIERRARFNPTSVKDCPVDPATLTDVRVTMAMTDGTEFTFQDSWRSSDVRSLPCRWTGKTVFVIGSSAKTQIRVRTSLPNKDGTERRVQTANGYYGHALRAKGRVVVPAKSRACVVTDLEFEPPSSMSARLQPLRGSGLDICPAMYTYNEGATQSGVDVLNPTDTDLIVEPGQDVAVVQFYTSVLAAVELDFTDEDAGDGLSAPVEPSNACVATDAEPKKAFPELTFGDRDTTVAQGSVGPREIRMIKYDMRSFMEQCVSRYVELCGPKYKATLRSADTPFLDESRPEFDTNPDRPEVNRLLGHPIDTPVPPGKGVLGDCAAAVLMKILYGARMGRYDLIRPVQALASLITKWDGLCDKKLHRLVCYINSTLDLNLYGWIGDAPEMLELVLYCDADLAGDRTDSKSTSGVFMCLLGPRSFMPLNALSKKQTSVSKSTPEAEIVSLDHAVYKLGLPALSMWEYMLGRRFRFGVMEDNEAAIRVIITGHNPNMRHMSRTQRIDISALNERYHAGDFMFVTCPSQFEAGDILTKACTDAKVWGKNKQPPKKAAAKTPAARSPQPKSPSPCVEGLPSGPIAPTTERPPAPPIPTEQADSNITADEAPVPIQTPRDESTGGGKRSEDVPIGLRMKAMMLKIGVQEIPQASIWQRLEQLACNSGFDQRLHQLVDSFLLSNHPLADKQRKQYPREFMDFIDRYRVMCALAFSRVATLSGDAAGVREKMDLTMALARHCMHFQAHTFKGSRETLSNDTLRLMGTCYIPSPLASWNRNLMGFSSSSAEQRWLRTDTSIKHNDLTKLSPIELSRDAVNPAEAAKFFKGFLQLRPTLSFIPGAFLAIKALNRFPTLDSLKEQATHLENDRKEHGYDLPAVDANGIGEVAAFRNEDDDENNPLMRGWVSFMKAMAEAYPGRCVSIDDTLNWGASTQMTYEDGASQITIRPTDGWVYVPAMNSDIYDPQETFLHGTNLRYLWSILAHGGLFGEDYVTDDHGSHEPCVWVTGHASEAAGSYASGTYLGGGYWFQVMICVSRTMVNSHSRTTKKLGGSQKQIRVGTRFLELCGIAFRPFRLLDDREQGVSPNYVVHGHRFLSADGMKAVAWHPWMEASPIDPRILKLLGDSVARDNVEFADLTIQGGNTTQQAASTEPEQPVATAADDQAAAGGSEATERITVNPVVLRRNHWMPDTYGTSEQATVGGRCALLSELQSSSYRIELAPFFQYRAPILGEEGSQGLPKYRKLETIAGGPSKEWEAWCRHYRKAYGALLGNFGYTPAKNIKGIGIVYDEENTTDIIGAPVWSPADALVAVSIHGIRTVTTMASTIAFGGAPPTIKPAVPSKPQRFVVMHDGLLTFRSAKSWHDGEMNTHLKNALASFGFPESEVRVQAFDESEKLKEMVDTLELMRSDPSVPPSNVHILILWKGDEMWKMDQGWNKLTGDIDTARSQYAKLTARDALEKYNTIYGSVSLCGPVSPSMGYLPTLPGPLFEKYREEMRSIWDEIRRSNFLSLSFDAILEGLPYLKGYHIMHESKTIGVLCTRICSMFTLAALARFPSYATRREYQIAHDKMWARAPVPEERSTGTVKAIVHSTVQDLIEGADRGADHRAAKTVGMSQLGFDDDDDEDMVDDAGPTAPENPIKQEQTTLADLPGVRHPDPIELPTTPVPGQAMPVSPGLAPAATNDEESSNSSDDAGQQGDGDAAMPEIKKEESDEEFNELLEGMTEAFGKLPTPRDAERTVAANRDAARPPAVPTIPLSTMKKPKPIGGVEAAGPTAESRQGYAHFESQVSEIEARREQAAKMKAHIAEVAKGATGVENAEHLRSIADGLAKIMDPNMSDDNVFQGAMYPPGDYALDAVTNRLAQGRRRVESNSNLIREMASDRFTPVLINRDTGETVSAIDARWTPEYGNRGELEAKVGAIISNLDAVVASMSTLPVFHPHIPSTYGMARSLLNTYQSLQIAIRHRGMGAMSFEQMVFKPEDLEVPTPDDWPDLIAPTRVALVNNTAARLTREDLKLPPGFAMQRRVTEFRRPEEDPVQSLMGLTDDLSYGTTGRSGDDRLSQFQRSVAVQLRNTAGFIASEFQKHARSIAASSSRRSDASGALSSQGEGAADNDLPSTEQVSVTSERATTPPPPNVAPPPPPTAAAPPRASEESAKEDDDDTKMDDDTADQKPEQKHEEDVDMGSGKELQDEVPGKAPPPAARTAENPPEHGVRSSSPNVMVAQGAVLSGARGPDIDIDPTSTTADQAANDPRNFRIEGPGIKATTIHRPDQMPERGIDSIAPIVQYEMTSVPIALTDFVIPGLDMGIDDSVHGRLVSATCLPPTDEQRKYSRRRFAMLSSNQTVYLNVALHKKPVKGDHDSFLRPESYEDCREINDAVRHTMLRIPDAGMINLVRKLMFRVLTQTKEYPSATAVRAQNRPQDQERGIPLYSHFDQSGIIASDVIPMYMEREREYMKANAGENDGRILLQTNILDDHGEPTELTTQCIMEIARTDNNRMFEFFYSTIDNDGSPQFVGIRATYGFGPDNFSRFRLLTKCQHGPFIQLAQDLYVGGERKRNVARYHPQYGWGCATIREFFGYMSDCKINPPKGRLFLTLLPYAPGSGHNNEWEEVYMNVRMNPGRETLSNTASSQSMLPEGMGSNRMIVFAIDLHMIAAGINPIVFHPRGYYAVKDSIPLACMPIAYFMDTGSLVFNTAFKYTGGPKFGTGPKRGDHKRETWPLASFDCPMCGASFPVGLHMCHSCTKPIHYPDGMFYADPVNPFQIEYYGSHANWLNELIERNELKEFRLHEYPAIKQLRNFPVSRSLAEDHRQTAFFGVPPIKCTAADTSPKEVESFKKSVRGTIQGAIRLDISIERLVAGITGKEARCGVEEFLNSQSIGGTIDYTVDSDMVEKIRLAHLPLQNANLAMRRQIRLSTEFGTLDEFRATITDTQKYQRYMRVDSESLSTLLAKVTLTTCYGIPMKGEPGYISDDEAEEIEGTAAATEKPKGKGKGEEEPDVQAINWRDLDPLGRKFIPHHTDPRFTIIAEGNTALLDAPETPDETRKEFKEFIRDHSAKIKEWFDDDRATEKTFFTLVEGVKDQLPDTKRTDPVLMKKNEDVFEALPDELEEPQGLFDVAARQARRRDDTPQRRVQATEQRQASIPEAHAVPVPPDDEDEDDAELERAIRPGPTSQRTGREHLGGVAPETTPPPPLEMPPPSNPPSRKMSRQSGYNVPHAEGETLMVSGRAPYSDQMGLPLVLRMKTRVPESDLDNPTIEDIIRMYHAPNTLPVVRKKAANVIVSMNANPDDPINMKAAGVIAPSAEETGFGMILNVGLRTLLDAGDQPNVRYPTQEHVRLAGGRVFEKSTETENVDIFISHSWSAGTRPKFLALCLYFNLGVAVKCSIATWFAVVVLLVSCFGLTGLGGSYLALPCLVYLPLATFLVVFIFAQQLFGGFSWFGGQSVWLDILCVHQTDMARKAEQIAALPTFVAHSSRMLILWDDTYFSRLWCNLELATFVRRCGAEKLDFVPLWLAPWLLLSVLLDLMTASILELLEHVFPSWSATWASHITLHIESVLGKNPAMLTFATMFIIWMISGTIYLPVSMPSFFSFRTKLRGHKAMLDQMATFDVRAAECTLSSDRDVIEHQVKDLFSDVPAKILSSDSDDTGEIYIPRFMPPDSPSSACYDPLDRFNDYVRGTVRKFVMAQIGDELHVPFPMCLAASLPMIFYSSVSVLACENGPCEQTARLSGCGSVAEYMALQAGGWALCILTAFPLTFPVLLRMIKFVLSYGEGPLQLVLAFLCCPIAYAYSSFCGGLAWSSLISLALFYSPTQLAIFCLTILFLVAQVILLFSWRNWHDVESDAMDCRCLRREQAVYCGLRN